MELINHCTMSQCNLQPETIQFFFPPHSPCGWVVSHILACHGLRLKPDVVVKILVYKVQSVALTDAGTQYAAQI